MMELSAFRKLSVGGVALKQLFVNGVQVWKSGYKNWVTCSTESDGLTVYNGGLGYKDGYRVRSGGAEAENSYTTITGFIPLQTGDTLRIYPAFSGGNTDNTINFYDSDFTNLGQITDSGSAYGICAGNVSLYDTQVAGEVSVLTLQEDHDPLIRYVRIGNRLNTYPGGIIASGSEMIVTVNEEIE